MADWTDTSAPCLDPDSPLQAHMGEHGIPRFQTRDRYFYAPLGEACCGQDFVNVFFQQMHHFPHCPDCASILMRSASIICWQCRTYFRRYGTGLSKQVMGISYQRHDAQSVTNPSRGTNQARLPPEAEAQTWRDEQLRDLPDPILQILLPRPPTCYFWRITTDFMASFQNQSILNNLSAVLMPYYNPDASAPLPDTPRDGFQTGLSLQPTTVDEDHQGDYESDPSSDDK